MDQRKPSDRQDRDKDSDSDKEQTDTACLAQKVCHANALGVLLFWQSKLCLCLTEIAVKVQFQVREKACSKLPVKLYLKLSRKLTFLKIFDAFLL